MLKDIWFQILVFSGSFFAIGIVLSIIIFGCHTLGFLKRVNAHIKQNPEHSIILKDCNIKTPLEFDFSQPGKLIIGGKNTIESEGEI